MADRRDRPRLVAATLAATAEISLPDEKFARVLSALLNPSAAALRRECCVPELGGSVGKGLISCTCQQTLVQKHRVKASYPGARTWTVRSRPLDGGVWGRTFAGPFTELGCIVVEQARSRQG